MLKITASLAYGIPVYLRLHSHQPRPIATSTLVVIGHSPTQLVQPLPVTSYSREKLYLKSAEAR